MRQLFNKPIEMPQQAAVIISTSVLCGISYLGSGHGGFLVSQLSDMFAFFFGPLLCLYLFFNLAHFLFGWLGWMDLRVLGLSDFLIGFVNLFIINQWPNN